MAFDHPSDEVPPLSDRAAEELTPVSKENARGADGGVPLLRVIALGKDAVRRMDASIRLSELDPDVESALSYCEDLRIDVTSVFDFLGPEASPEDFFVLLREYLCTLEVAVTARAPADGASGVTLKKNVHIFQKKSNFRNAAEAYADTVLPDERDNLIFRLKSVRRFVEGKLPR